MKLRFRLITVDEVMKTTQRLGKLRCRDKRFENEENEAIVSG